MEKGNEFTILIADRNPHVRAFLQREMMAEGYRVYLAKNGREVLEWIYHHGPLDLVVLDVDLPDADEIALLENLNDRIPLLPVVVHAFPTDFCPHATSLNKVSFVEKRGNSIEPLKKTVSALLKNMHYEEKEQT